MFELFLFILFLSLTTFAFIKVPFLKNHGAKKSLIMTLWAYKVLAGVAFYLMFSEYQPYSSGCDSNIYFSDATKLAAVAHESPTDYFKLVTGIYPSDATYEHYTSKMEYWNRSYPSVVPNDNRIVIRVNSLLSFISFGYYRIHLLFMAFFSFIGLLLIYKTILKLFSRLKRTLAIIIFIIPSTVFWTAGVLKEPLLILLLGTYIYTLTNLCKSFKIKHLLIFITVLYLMIFTKPYVLFLLIPISVAFIISERTKSKKIDLIYLSSILLFFGISFIFHKVDATFSVSRILTQKQVDFNAMDIASNSGSHFEIPPLDNSFSSLVTNSPMALFNTLTRPFLWEADSLPKSLSAIENILLLIVIGLFILRFKYKNIEHRNMWLFTLFFSLQLFILSGMITPNMGALARYRSIGIPFLLIALLSSFTPLWIEKHKKLKQLIDSFSSKFWN